MKDIDLDGNGELEFDEFLCMIKAAQRNEKEKSFKAQVRKKLSKPAENTLAPRLSKHMRNVSNATLQPKLKTKLLGEKQKLSNTIKFKGPHKKA